MLIASIILSALCLVLLIFLWQRSSQVENMVRSEMAQNRREFTENLDSFRKSMSDQLTSLMQLNETKLEHVRKVVDDNLQKLQADNNNKLEQMRETVDEKLQSTLERRLGESFKIVSERLEKVHAGLGEMQTLASGVGDLKKVLENVKAKGNLGEFQLASLLDQVLSPDQYETQVSFGASDQRGGVDYAVKLPGTDDQSVYLPIDSKFPTKDYENLILAQEKGNPTEINEALKNLEAQVKKEAKSISAKYIMPPKTTDFAVLFLPFEGLYAEVLRRPGLFESLQREYKVTITGPTTIIALLTSFRMGFRTLAVQKRASEVWQVLSSVKTEFGRFGDILDATKRKLETASKEIDKAAVRSRAIERHLRDVQELPNSASSSEVLLDTKQE